ncbi:MAG: trypsin-like peptidase domain-containing protein [Planctomycetota bacterium]
MTTKVWSALFLPVALFLCGSESTCAQEQGYEVAVSMTQPKIVKITGSGGFRGLEAYQSGFLISEDGFILTVWSYVLDSGTVTVTLNDGQRFEGTLAGYDPQIEIAVIKIEADGLPCFNLDAAVTAQPGSQILAFSNLFGVATGDEQASVLHGHIAANTSLDARQGTRDSTYQGDVYILDAITNNPGAAGGVVTNRRGELIGLIGKELKDKHSGNWLNFCIPASQLSGSALDIRSGKLILADEQNSDVPAEPMTPELLGIMLVPDVIRRTPPFVDVVVLDSPASRADIMPDDLVVEVNGSLTPSCRTVVAAMGRVDRDSPIEVTLQRGTEFIRIELEVGR